MEIIAKRENPLLERIEIEAIERGFTSTPPRIEVRKKLAELLKVDPELIIIEKISSKPGLHRIKASYYTSKEALQRIVHQHVLLRHLPKEERARVLEGLREQKRRKK